MFHTTEKLENMLEVMEIFVTSKHIDGLKPKREKVMRTSYGNTYDIQMDIRTEIKNIDISQLLSGNEMVLPHVAVEYGRLVQLCKLLEPELKRLDQYPEYKDELRQIRSVMKPKDIFEMFYLDLSFMRSILGVDLDITEWMTVAKKHALSEDEVEKINKKLDKYYPEDNNPRKK